MDFINKINQDEEFQTQLTSHLGLVAQRTWLVDPILLQQLFVPGTTIQRACQTQKLPKEKSKVTPWLRILQNNMPHRGCGIMNYNIYICMYMEKIEHNTWCQHHIIINIRLHIYSAFPTHTEYPLPHATEMCSYPLIYFTSYTHTIPMVIM